MNDEHLKTAQRLKNIIICKLENLNNRINSLEHTNTELKIILKYLESQIKDCSNIVSNFSIIENTLQATIKNINKLEETYKIAIQNNETVIKNIAEKLLTLDTQIQKLPLYFQVKETKKDLFEYIKIIPAILTIAGALATAMWLYIKHSIEGQ